MKCPKCVNKFKFKFRVKEARYVTYGGIMPEETNEKFWVKEETEETIESVTLHNDSVCKCCVCGYSGTVDEFDTIGVIPYYEDDSARVFDVARWTRGDIRTIASDNWNVTLKNAEVDMIIAKLDNEYNANNGITTKIVETACRELLTRWGLINPPRHGITIKWTVDDVASVIYDRFNMALAEDDLIAILDRLVAKHDKAVGINYQVVEAVAYYHMVENGILKR